MSTNDHVLNVEGATKDVVGGPHTPQQHIAHSNMEQTQKMVDETVEIMKTNVEKILERDHKTKELDYKADALLDNASRFEEQAVKLRKKAWFQNIKLQILTGVICAVILTVIIVYFQ